MSFRTASVFALTVGLAAPAFAQQLELPRPSPSAKITQTVGLTDITVEYSSPGVKGRKIWGKVVPYDKMWRAGANAATKVTFSKDVTIDGKKVPAGTYALFTIPSKTTWTVILNKDANQWGTAANYKEDLDAVRVKVKPQPAPMRERLAYEITDFTDDGATLALEWERVRIAVPVKLDTAAQVQASIDGFQKTAWRPWNQAADYMMESKKDYDAALALVDRSISIQEDWLNLFTKAQILAAKGKYKDALPLAEKADVLGAKSPMYFGAEEVKKAIAEWKAKK